MAKMTKEEWEQYRENYKQDFQESRVGKLLNSGVRNNFDSHIAKWNAKVDDRFGNLHYEFELQDFQRLDKSQDSTGLSALRVEVYPDAANQKLSDKDIFDALKKTTDCVDFNKAVNNCLHVESETPYPGSGNVVSGFSYGYDDTFKTDNAKIKLHMGFGKEFPKTYKDDVLSRRDVAEAVVSGYNDLLEACQDIYRNITFEKDGKEKYADNPKEEPMNKRMKRQPKAEQTVHTPKKDDLSR